MKSYIVTISRTSGKPKKHLFIGESSWQVECDARKKFGGLIGISVMPC